ncbi:MAG: hypothetical protein ABI960_02625 [Candidatus Eisenbacteria bacterium]
MRSTTSHIAPRRASGLLALAAFGLLALAGCKGTTPIKELLDDPSRYSGTVRIAGTVASAAGALGAGFYKVDDGTGKMTVVTKSGGVPREGAKVGVQGTLKSGYTLGTESLTVMIEDKRYPP